ncbi:hypothetical protein [Streptomyces sp. NPDC088794]|uniref:hypothetical protein n=1 Tax=Streptomyces sp. NPDC088794 TaxID=3365902 RepID=UPI003816550F
MTAGMVVPVPPVIVTVFVRPASSYSVVLTRVVLLAVSVSLEVSPQRSYSAVVVASWVGLEPPPVIAAAGRVRQTSSAHAGRPQAPVPSPV